MRPRTPYLCGAQWCRPRSTLIADRAGIDNRPGENDKRQKQGHTGKRDRIAQTDAEQKALEHPGCAQSSNQSDKAAACDEDKAFTQDESQDIESTRSPKPYERQFPVCAGWL